MRYAGLPPGTIIQQLYLRKRIKIIRQGLVEGTFLDVGAGEGYASQTLLSCGYKGIGIDLNKEACLENEK
jgi:2-polyprenyl-3-methyl-5-hydroxy-6-metoxy-1,4-benzoquinol methylase